MRKWTALFCIGVMVALAGTAPALADPSAYGGEAGLNVCNDSSRTVGVALGRRAEHGWQSEGWTRIDADACETIFGWPQLDPYYYIYATDETGGAWQGDDYLCSRGSDFLIVGTGDCLARGKSRTPFAEVATDGGSTWTVRLRDEGDEPRTIGATTTVIVRTPPEIAARDQLYEIVTSATPSAPLKLMLRQVGSIEGRDERQVVDLVGAYLVDLPASKASELRVWYRDSVKGPVAERLSFYDGGHHLVTVVRTAHGFALGIDPGRSGAP